MDIKPIRNKKDYKRVMDRIDEILTKYDGAGGFPKKGTPDSDELEVISILADDYENIHYPIDPPDPVDAIKFRMEQMDLTNADLARIIGGKPRVSEIMNHKRQLTLKMIRALNKTLHIPAEVLIREPEEEKKTMTANG